MATKAKKTKTKSRSKGPSSDREGSLYKQGAEYKTWQKRYMVLRGSELLYYANNPRLNPAEQPKGTVSLLAGYGYTVNLLPDSNLGKKVSVW